MKNDKIIIININNDKNNNVYRNYVYINRL